MIRQVLKLSLQASCYLAVRPMVLWFHVKARLLGADRAVEGSTQALSLVPGLVGQYLRSAFCGSVLAACHPTAVIGFGTVFSKRGARLDEHAYVGPYCTLGLVHVERDALLASGVHVPSGGRTHGLGDLSMPIRQQPGSLRTVRIGEGSWIGNGAIVMADVGRGTVVGAGAVVTRSLPDYVVAAGVPARVLRVRGASSARPAS